ncbi:AAA family ATPase [Desulfococcus sp.]|uniref:AAA family ATPase n=1 Tax=Desulfococcus sp. TaxID=2025834 RepID=UPI003592F42B
MGPPIKPAWQLFQCIDLERTALVLVGDHNQLPSVGPGNLLRDLVQSRMAPTVLLDQVGGDHLLSGNFSRRAFRAILSRSASVTVGRKRFRKSSSCRILYFERSQSSLFYPHPNPLPVGEGIKENRN